MRITFVLPELNLTGGVRVVAEYAAILGQKRHDVTVVAPLPKPISLKQHIKSWIKWKGYRLAPQDRCPYAVDHKQFRAEPRQKNKPIRFGFMYLNQAFRKSTEYQWDNSALLFEVALKDFVEDVDKG